MLAIFGFDFFYRGWNNTGGGYFEFKLRNFVLTNIFSAYPTYTTVLTTNRTYCMICNGSACSLVGYHTCGTNTSYN